MSGEPEVVGFHHAETSAIGYLAIDPATRHAVVIDPVLDYDAAAGRVSTATADAMLAAIAARGVTVDLILDTHPHADHLSAAQYLKERLGAPTGIGAAIGAVQALWAAIYNRPDFPCDGRQWDRLLADGETLAVGSLPLRVMHSPGHTLASATYVLGDAAFVHDTLFQPDSGTARCDFPGGSAAALWRSIQAILALPDATRLFTGHDYRPDGRPAAWESTVAEQKRSNVHLVAHRDEAAFVAMREARDRTLAMPKLILHALQVNIDGGRLPEPEANGLRYLRIPLGALDRS